MSAVLYACALLTHESAILFPLIVAAYLLLFETGGVRSMLRTCSPFLIALVVYLCTRFNALGAVFDIHFDTTGTAYARGFEVLRPHYSSIQVLMTIPETLILYLAVLAIPDAADVAHNVDWIVRAQPIVFIDVAALLVLAAIAFVLARRSPNRNIYLFCAVWIFLTMAPALNLNGLLWLVDDRYLYAPSFGWSLAVAVAAIEIASVGSTARNAVGAVLAMSLAFYVLSTVRIERYWHDDVAYFTSKRRDRSPHF